jgi:hypothetical protein
VLIAIALSTGAWSQEWGAVQERDLRWSVLQTMTGSRTSYARLSKLQEDNREAFKNLFSSPNSTHVLDIPGTPGLILGNTITAAEYLDVAAKVLQQEDLNIETELLWVSPSVEVSSIHRNVSLVFRKKIKWYPAQLDTPLEWVVTLRAELEAEVNKDGNVQDIKIASVRLESGAQAYVRVLTEIRYKPIPFLSQSSQFPLTVDGHPLEKNKDSAAIVLVPASGVDLDVGDAGDVMLLGKNKLLTLPKVSQSKYLNEPNILDISQTISGVKYYGRFTAGLTAVQMIGHGKYQSTPVSNISSSWSPGFRLSFLAPINDGPDCKWNWTTILGLQTSTASVNFNATQFIQHAIDADAMEYERMTDVTLGQESLVSNTIFVGLGSAYDVGNFFMKATVNGTYTKSRYEANADIQQRGHYPSLYGITIDDPGIYDFGVYSTSSVGAYDNALGWMGEAAVGYRFPFGSSDWLNSARPMCYLSAGIRHHSEAKAGDSQWVEETQSLQGALNAFGSNNFQTYFIEIAFDLRRRTPPSTS